MEFRRSTPPHALQVYINPFQMLRDGPGGRRQRVWMDTQVIPTGTH